MPAYALEFVTERGEVLERRRHTPTSDRPEHPRDGDVLWIDGARYRVRAVTRDELAGTARITVAPED